MAFPSAAMSVIVMFSSSGNGFFFLAMLVEFICYVSWLAKLFGRIPSVLFCKSKAGSASVL